MRSGPPRWLAGAGHWLLRRRFPADMASEMDGDLLELWEGRCQAGRRDLRRAYAVDLANVLLRRRPPRAVPSGNGRPAASPFIEGIARMLQDVRHALRVIRREPLLAAVTVLTLGIGIAAATSIYSAVDRLLLRPLPYPDPEALVMVESPPYSFAGGRMQVSPRVRDLGVLAGIGLYAAGGVNIGGAGDPLRVPAAVAEPGFFDAFDVTPAIGRVYTRDDDVAGANAVAVISDGLWRRLGADPSILDRTLEVNLRPFRILGVMPPGFDFPGRTDVWIPVLSDRQVTGQAFAPDVIARLRPGMPIDEAEAVLDRFDRERTTAGVDREPVRLVPLHRRLTEPVRPLVLLLAAGVALLLAVSCSNAAGLLLSRVARRQEEFVLRRALGGSRWRLARLLLAESLVLSLAASVVGIAGATAVLRAIPLLVDDPVPGVDLSRVDLPLLFVAVGFSLLTGAVFGLAPGVAASAQPASRVVRAGVAVAGGRGWARFRATLVVLQVAGALVLLTVTGAAVTTMVRLARVDLGFGNERSLALEVTLPLERYAASEQVRQFYQEAAARLRAVPGVLRVGATGVLPGHRTVGVGLRLAPVELPAQEASSLPPSSMLFASPDYFEAAGVPIVRGRPFLPTDASGAPRVVVLSESAAQALWPDGRDPIGRSVRVSGPEPGEPHEVVGIAADVLLRGPEALNRTLQFYRPVLQVPPFGAMAFVVESAVPLGSLPELLRAALADVDPGLPLYNIRPLRDITADFLATQRLTMALTGAFASVTLLLAAIGLYGVMALLVAQRTQEIGIRMALGAGRGRVIGAVLAQGLRMGAAGVAIGAVGSGLAARLIAAFVPNIDAPAWPTLALNAAVLLGVCAFAAWMPARRAASVDPLLALRRE